MKQVIIKLVYIIMLLGNIKVTAQQEALYSQYMYNTLALNPAYTGSRALVNVTGLFRAQWVGVDGAPLSQNLSIDAPIPNKNVGVGLVILNDRVGATNNTGVHASYGYHVKFERATLSFGLKLGIVQYTLRLTNGTVNQGNISDDRVFAYNGSSYIPCFGAGAYYKTDKYYAGISVPTTYISTIGNRTQVMQNTQTPIVAMGGYTFILNKDIQLKPSLLYKFVTGAPMQLDINCSTWMYDVIGVGFGYRSGDAVIGMIEFKATPDLHIGYAYDYTVSKLTNYNSSTHELMLRYQFKMPSNKYIAPNN